MSDEMLVKAEHEIESADLSAELQQTATEVETDSLCLCGHDSITHDLVGAPACDVCACPAYRAAFIPLSISSRAVNMTWATMTWVTSVFGKSVL